MIEFLAGTIFGGCVFRWIVRADKKAQKRDADFEREMLRRIEAHGPQADMREMWPFDMPRRPAIGVLYITVDRMEKRGWVVGEQGAPLPERGGKSKRFYTITDAGRQILAEEATDAG